MERQLFGIRLEKGTNQRDSATRIGRLYARRNRWKFKRGRWMTEDQSQATRFY